MDANPFFNRIHPSQQEEAAAALDEVLMGGLFSGLLTLANTFVIYAVKTLATGCYRLVTIHNH